MKRLPTILTAALMAAALTTVGQADPQHRYRGAAPRPEVYVGQTVYTPGQPVQVVVNVDRPAWVQVYETDGRGRVRRLVRRAKGVHVVPGRPLVLNQLRAKVPGWHRIEVIAARRPLQRTRAAFMRFAYAGGCWICDGIRACDHPHSQRSQPNTGYGQAVGTSVLEFRVAPHWRADRSFRGQFDWIPAGAHVYVGGRYLGCGPSSCRALPVGSHRVTVVTPAGRKISRSVYLGQRDARYRAEVDRGRKENRRR